MKYNLENRRRSALARREADVVRWTAFLNEEKSKKADEELVKHFTAKLKTSQFDVARLKERIGA